MQENKNMDPIMRQISIIMPYYNQYEVLEFTLPLWLEIFHDDEFILVDDGSGYDILDLIKKYGNRLIYIRQPRNGYGLPKALNKAWKIASNERVMFANCDIIPNETLLACKNKGITNEILCFLRNECLPSDIKNILLTKSLEVANKLCSIPDIRIVMQVVPENIRENLSLITPMQAYGFSLSLPKDYIRKVGGFCEEIENWGGEDLLLCLQIEDQIPEAQFFIHTEKPVLHLEDKDDKTKMKYLLHYFTFFPLIARGRVSDELFDKYKLDKLKTFEE